MKASTITKLESLVRPLIAYLPPRFVISQYSRGRIKFLEKLKDEEIPEEMYNPPKEYERILWGLTFRSPIMNAAGMFKNGECYEIATRQGAGAYLGGTTTRNYRRGNQQNGVYLPFVPYPRSHSASNWLGLPNDGDEKNSVKVKTFERIEGFPIGWSVMKSPDLNEEEGLKKLIEGMKKYEYFVDFIEENRSCPNTGEKIGKYDFEKFKYELKYVKEHFIDQRRMYVPIIVKLSTDTSIEDVPRLLDLLFYYQYDGVNFGNTSVDYSLMREKIHSSERKLFDFFTQTFEGGISGRPLKEKSLELCLRAVEYAKAGASSQEFHVIRTGGIESMKDIRESEKAGISLNQWFTGYWENIAKYGHNIYREFFKS